VVHRMFEVSLCVECSMALQKICHIVSIRIYFPFPFPLPQFIFPQYSSNFCQYKCSRYTQINFIEIEIQFWPYISRYMDSNLGTNQFNSNEIQTWPPVELSDILLYKILNVTFISLSLIYRYCRYYIDIVDIFQN